MRACEGCRRRKIKCDAATTNTWPCSACIRLKLHCVRPNGYDGSADSQIYEPSQSPFEDSNAQDSFRQQLPLPLPPPPPQQQQQQQQLLTHAPKSASIYASQTSYQDSSSLYHSVQYTEPQTVPHSLQYSSVHPSGNVVDQQYPTPNAFPTPPLRQASHPGSHPGSHAASSPEAYQDRYAQQDLADLLGSLKVNEAGTGKKVALIVGFICLIFMFSTLLKQ
jgi:Fungal Zn(2)-Cys(6) binuclear cluster domain